MEMSLLRLQRSFLAFVKRFQQSWWKLMWKRCRRRRGVQERLTPPLAWRAAGSLELLPRSQKRLVSSIKADLHWCLMQGILYKVYCMMAPKVGQVGCFYIKCSTWGRHVDWRRWFVCGDAGVQRSERKWDSQTKVISHIHPIWRRADVVFASKNTVCLFCLCNQWIKTTVTDGADVGGGVTENWVIVLTA